MRRACLFSLLLVTTTRVTAQRENVELEAKLDSRLTQYDLSATGLAQALVRTSKQFQLPIGIEWVKDNQALHGLSHTWKDETVRQVLHSIVDAYPGYALQVEGGVIHVFRQDLRRDIHNFLNLKVPDFFQVRPEPAGLTNVRLREVMQNIVSPRGLPPDAGEAGSYTSGNVSEKPVSLDLRSLSVREALEKIAALSEHNICVVTFSDTADLTPTGYRRTETLWHPTPFLNTEQPMWDLIAYTDPPMKPAGGHLNGIQ